MHLVQILYLEAMISTKAVIVATCRSPFVSVGSHFANLSAYQLAQGAIRGLINQIYFHTNHVEQLLLGQMIQQLTTHNVARETALYLGLPPTSVAHTVSMGSLSSGKAITNAVDQIHLGKAACILTGGVESISHAPVQYPQTMQQKVLALQEMQGITDYLKFATSFRPSDFLPEAVHFEEFTTQHQVGQSSDYLAARFGISRADQDAWAIRSHRQAIASQAIHLQDSIICEMAFPPTFESIHQDNLVNLTIDPKEIADLKPSFTGPDGSTTEASLAPEADGAVALLILSELKALELGYRPLATIKDYCFTANNPQEAPLTGAADAIPQLLKQSKLPLSEIGVWEVHEASAGQLLANLAQIDQTVLGPTIERKKVNAWGGSIAYGNPYGATAARLVMQATHRIQQEEEMFAIAAASGEGGQGMAILLERY